jgi:hypothetical protein
MCIYYKEKMSDVVSEISAVYAEKYEIHNFVGQLHIV